MDYNNVFERLYDPESGQEDVLVGLVAYGLYKIAKREWMINFQETNDRRPTIQDCAAFASAQTDMMLDSFRSKAQSVINEFSQELLSQEAPIIRAEALKGTFWTSFWPSFWSAVAFTFTLIILYLILNYMGVPIPKIGN